MTPRLLLLATKDLMSYRRRPPGIATGAELLAAVPALAADVTVEDVMAEPAFDLTPGTMADLARRARAALAGFDGVVVTHGLDTIEDTACLADLVAGPGPIVFTGGVRALDDVSSDGPGNLADALTVAADPAFAGAGALVCLGGEVHAGRWVTLLDADSPAGLSSAPHPMLGRVRGSRVEVLAAPPPRPPDPRGEPESEVALIRAYPGIEGNLLIAATDAGARGVVLEGTGAYNVPASLLAAISDLTDWDIPVVVASRARAGRAGLDERPLGTGLAGAVGAIGSRGLPAGKARAALMVALAAGGGVAAAREYFARL
ncbi:asparaginase domain-containing protein [Dactylosporangium sp. CA-139066]|uniref:asparaginase domain-containing protein n=1 Tax=Dactylosporangium sp. CA-139066 TaxID=3239930 RepID=UPI003D8B5088